jgi:hypothetical protein
VKLTPVLVLRFVTFVTIFLLHHSSSRRGVHLCTTKLYLPEYYHYYHTITNTLEVVALVVVVVVLVAVVAVLGVAALD